MNDKNDKYLIYVDKSTYDLIENYRIENQYSTQSLAAEIIIREYIKLIKGQSFFWAFGIVAVYALEILFTPPKTWAIFTQPFSFITILHFIGIFIFNLFVGYIAGIFLCAIDNIIKIQYEITILPHKIRNFIFPVIVLTSLFLLTILYVTN